ncbi:hypothetical protein DY000_02001246 [Brassica cretica]|uniref:Ig-like domain-containing protein n=3 Tax=Brassica TaxID=3705 RepID=A0ABQ7C5T9_BRACR|nr:hypothetical protein DY000_02001246 [Brassica cretica]
MVFRGDTVMSVAHLSADIFQRWIPASERIRSGEMLQLVCCFPLQQLGRFVSWFWNYICVPPPEILYYERSSSSSSSSIVNSQNYYHLHLESVFLKQSGLKIKRGFEKFNGIQFRINVIWQRWLATSFGPSPV